MSNELLLINIRDPVKNIIMIPTYLGYLILEARINENREIPTLKIISPFSIPGGSTKKTRIVL
jgi:hypothetical protein